MRPAGGSLGLLLADADDELSLVDTRPQDRLTTTPSIGAREGQPGSSMRWKSCRRPTTSPGRTLTPHGMTSSFRQQYALMVSSF